jgi:integrase
MAIVTRKRKRGPSVYYVVLTWQRRPIWERAGTNRRDAETLERQRKDEIRRGTYQPQAGARATTVRQWAAAWLATRDVRSVKDEARWLRLHVLPRSWFADLHVADVRPRHTDQLVRELKAEGRLSDKSVSNVLGVLHVLFKRAVLAELAAANPVALERGLLRRSRQVEPEIYTPAEVRVLTRHHEIAWPVRVLNALTLLGGLREGEACGRRWRDLATDASPLWALSVHDQYDEQPLKTDRARLVPVHPELATALEAWGREGFELLTGHPPSPDDFIVPNVGRWRKRRHHTRSSYYKAFVRGCLAVDIRPRTLHATRHTFVTLCRRGGAPKDVLEKVTHNARGDIVDRYTHWQWEPLCAAVLCLDLDTRPELHPSPGNTEKSGAAPRWLGQRKSALLPETPQDVPGSIPGASTTKRHDSCRPREERQEPRQSLIAESDAATVCLYPVDAPVRWVVPDRDAGRAGGSEHSPALWGLAAFAYQAGLL